MGRELPLVTVITPAYNRASYLDETVRSVLSQDYPKIEYIVLDDGSTDETPQVLRKYEGRFRQERHPNMGETRTVNKGFIMARGEIIGVVNSDDPLLPGAVRRAAETMAERPDLLVVYPDWNMIDAQGKVIRHVETWEYNYIDMLRKHHCVPGPGAFFRREVVENLKGRDPRFRYVGDFDFWLRAGLLGPFARIPETLATFRLHPESASVSHQGASMAEEHIRLIEKIYSLPRLPAEVLKVRKEAYSSANYIAGCVFGESASFARKGYFLKALRFAPMKYFGEYKDRRSIVLQVIFGFLYNYGRMFFNRLRDACRPCGS